MPMSSQRFDSEGFFWNEPPQETKSGKKDIFRPRPETPDTGWRCPNEFPRLDDAKMIAVDCETNDPGLAQGKGPGVRSGGYICGLAIGTDDGGRWYFPTRHEGGGNMDEGMVMRWAKAELGRSHQPKVGANLMYDLDYLAEAGVPVAGQMLDVQIAEPLIDEHSYSYALGSLGKKYLGEGKTEEEMYRWQARAFGGNPTRKAQAGNIWRTPPALVGPYAESDVDLPFRILEEQKKVLHREGMDDLFTMELRFRNR